MDWFARNQHADGSWLYDYNADTDRAKPEYNVVRHAGAIEGLYQAAAAGLPRALDSADRGTEWALDRLTTRDDWSTLFLGGEIPTGATALLVAGLDIRREATGDPRYDTLLRRLGRFLVAQTEPSGAVLASYDPIRDRPVPGEYSKYYTGEAYWALARLHLTFPGEGWGKVADRIGAYLATKRDDVEDHWPPIEDHWAAYGLSETVLFPERGRPPLTSDELALRAQPGRAVRLGDALDQPALRAVGRARARAARAPRRRLRRDGRGTGRPLADRARATRGWPTFAVRSRSVRPAWRAWPSMRSRTRAEAASEKNPSRVEGAWFRDGETRMDDQQHALAALLRTLAIVRAGGGSGGTSDETPAVWLWALVLLLALNPIRAAFGIPRADGGGDAEPVRLALLGGAAGALLVVAASAVGPPLLDALDVSDPSFRTGAGIVAVLAGITDLFRRPPRSGPIPFPLVARPALLILALGAGADRGVLPSIIAMAIGVAALAALTAAAPADHPRARAFRWGARLLAAALIAGGVTLVIHGILDV